MSPEIRTDKNTGKISIRSAGEADLDSINRVIETSVMTWALPERVKRLSLPVYRYTRQDMAHLCVVVAEHQRGQVLGVAAWEQADPHDAPAGRHTLLLHGIYVDPAYHRQGIGRRLFAAAESAVRHCGYDGLLVRAQRDATVFFKSLGMHRLDNNTSHHRYANRLWKDLTACDTVEGL